MPSEHPDEQVVFAAGFETTTPGSDGPEAKAQGIENFFDPDSNKTMYNAYLAPGGSADGHIQVM